MLFYKFEKCAYQFSLKFLPSNDSFSSFLKNVLLANGGKHFFKVLLYGSNLNLCTLPSHIHPLSLEIPNRRVVLVRHTQMEILKQIQGTKTLSTAIAALMLTLIHRAVFVYNRTCTDTDAILRMRSM